MTVLPDAHPEQAPRVHLEGVKQRSGVDELGAAWLRSFGLSLRGRRRWFRPHECGVQPHAFRCSQVRVCGGQLRPPQDATSTLLVHLAPPQLHDAVRGQPARAHLAGEGDTPP